MFIRESKSTGPESRRATAERDGASVGTLRWRAVRRRMPLRRRRSTTSRRKRPDSPRVAERPRLVAGGATPGRGTQRDARRGATVEDRVGWDVTQLRGKGPCSRVRPIRCGRREGSTFVGAWRSAGRPREDRRAQPCDGDPSRSGGAPKCSGRMHGSSVSPGDGFVFSSRWDVSTRERYEDA